MSKRTRTLLRVVLAPVLASLTLAGCGGIQHQHGGGHGIPVEGGSVSFALPPAATPNWILPLATPGYTAGYNTAVQNEIDVPLYDYDGTSGTVRLDERASAALPPVYSADGRTVTITLKRLNWSDGTPVSSRDVEFWYNLIKADKNEWAAYTSGLMPDDVTAFHIVDSRTFTLRLDKVYNEDWFTANQLSYIVPLPTRHWDRTSATAPVGDADTTPSGATRVFDYLVGEAKQLGTYSTNPLWKVSDGPFTLAQFTADGQVTLARNTRYTGPDPAHLDKVRFLTFTSASAEYNVLVSGGLDYGYVPPENLGQKPRLQAAGYRVTPWNGWSITYIPYNFENPAMGAVFRQLYVRQAIQHAVDQPAISSVIWRGAASPDYGPVPQQNDADFLGTAQRRDPYPFDLTAARQLLTSHGWRAGGDGIDRCVAPGTGPGECGRGVAAGTRLSMTLLTESGSQETDDTMQELKSELSRIGIDMRISEQPLNTVLADSVPCKPSDASCSWQLSYFGTQGSWYFPAYPSGEELFATGASANFGNYSDPRVDQQIAQSTGASGSGSATPATTNSPDVMRQYSDYLARQLPVIWLPNPPYQISAIDSALHGVAQDPMAGLLPQRWYWTR